MIAFKKKNFNDGELETKNKTYSKINYSNIYKITGKKIYNL